MYKSQSKVPLSQLPLGNQGIVERITCEGLNYRRMLDLGLVPGTKIKALRKSPSGDPIAYLIRGTIIAFRQDQAKSIMISII